MGKVPVEVEIEDRYDGQVIPRAIIWNDGRRFLISRVLFHGASLANEYHGKVIKVKGFQVQGVARHVIKASKTNILDRLEMCCFERSRC